MTIAIDTNVLVRLLVRDDEAQHAAAQRLTSGPSTQVRRFRRLPAHGARRAPRSQPFPDFRRWRGPIARRGPARMIASDTASAIQTLRIVKLRLPPRQSRGSLGSWILMI